MVKYTTIRPKRLAWHTNDEKCRTTKPHEPECYQYAWPAGKAKEVALSQAKKVGTNVYADWEQPHGWLATPDGEIQLKNK